MSRYQSFAVLLSYTMAEETVKGKEHIFEKIPVEFAGVLLYSIKIGKRINSKQRM